MISINGQDWDKLEISDIRCFLDRSENETFFFDNKVDEVANDKIAKEVCAFANTYGGYVFIGIDNCNNFIGCRKWTEERIHNVIHDSISPLPVIDIKKMSIDSKDYILVIRVEEGERPPYISNNGLIYERLASGSYPIRDSNKREEKNKKRKDEEYKIQRKIETNMPEIDYKSTNNLIGFLDVGFSLKTNAILDLHDNFNKIEWTPVSELIRSKYKDYSISKVGYTYQIVVGKTESNDNYDKKLLLDSGLNNFLEIYPDGSAICRILLIGTGDTDKVDITGVVTFFDLFEDVYKLLVDTNLEKKYVYACKYEKLHAYRQFEPYYNIESMGTYGHIFDAYHKSHIDKYGNNRIVQGTRIPITGFRVIDKEFFDQNNMTFNRENIISELFHTAFINMGYIDMIS